MAFKKHFKVLLPAAMLLAQILGSVFTSLLSFATTSLASVTRSTVVGAITLFLTMQIAACTAPLINRKFEKGGYIQKIWNTAEVLVVQSVCSAFFVWQHCKVYFRPPDASWLGDALVTLIPMIIGLSNVLAMLIQIAIYAILNHRKNRRAALTQPQPTPPIEP